MWLSLVRNPRDRMEDQRVWWMQESSTFPIRTVGRAAELGLRPR